MWLHPYSCILFYFVYFCFTWACDWSVNSIEVYSLHTRGLCFTYLTLPVWIQAFTSFLFFIHISKNSVVCFFHSENVIVKTKNEQVPELNSIEKVPLMWYEKPCQKCYWTLLLNLNLFQADGYWDLKLYNSRKLWIDNLWTSVAQ